MRASPSQIAHCSPSPYLRAAQSHAKHSFSGRPFESSKVKPEHEVHRTLVAALACLTGQALASPAPAPGVWDKLGKAVGSPMTKIVEIAAGSG